MIDKTDFIQGDTANVSASPTEVLTVSAVYLFSNGDGFTYHNRLTPANARLLAAQLMSAADAADAQNAEKLKVA